MPENVTKVSGATEFDFYLGNYSYTDFSNDAEALRFKLCTTTHRLLWKNAAGTVVKAMADASTTSNHAQKRVLFTDANGAANTNSKLLYDNDTDVLGLGLETLHSWKSTHSAFDIGSQGALSYGATELGLEENAYYDDTDDRWEYIGTGYATRIVQTAGTIALKYAASGTADNPITWTTGLHMTTAGKVLIGNGTSPDTLVHIYAGSAGDISALAGSVLTVENSDNTLISILSGTNNKSGVVFGEGGDNDGLCSFVDYSLATPEYQVRTSGLAGSLRYSMTLSGIHYWYGSGTFDQGLTVNEGGGNVDSRIESANLTHAFFLKSSEDKFAFGHGTPDVFVHIERDTATTDAVQYLFRLTETCSDTVGDGFGVGMQFELEASTQATNYVAGTLAVLWEDEDTGDSDMVIQVMDGWSLAEKMRVSSNGAVGLSGAGADTVSYAAAAAGKYRLLYCDENGNVVVGDNDLADNNVS